jgi:hypothetical protein
MSWRTRWRIYEYVRNSIWLVPALFAVFAIAMGIVLPDVDESVNSTIGISFGAEAGRAVLGALAGGMITFTGFVFSILLLAVQFGSSQFSPRMLRRFLRDPTTKVSLGIFMATFIYALLVLRVVGTASEESFVPSNSISIALMLLLLSMIMFLRLISRTTQGLRVAAVLHDLGRDARQVIDRVYPEPAGEDEADHRPVAVGPARTVPFCGEPGILRSVDTQGLVERATAADAVIERVPRVGDLLAVGSPLFRVHDDGGSAIPDGSGFHAAFVAGLAFRALLGRDPAEMNRLSEEVGDVLNGITFLLFGAVLLEPALGDLSWQLALYAVLSLTLVRMVPVAAAMVGSGARPRTVAFLGWFGPRGLASIVFALIVVQESALPHQHLIVLAVYLTVGLSVFAHGLSAAPLARRYARWYESHPRDAVPPLESAPAEIGRLRGAATGFAGSPASSGPPTDRGG